MANTSDILNGNCPFAHAKARCAGPRGAVATKQTGEGGETNGTTQSKPVRGDRSLREALGREAQPSDHSDRDHQEAQVGHRAGAGGLGHLRRLRPAERASDPNGPTISTVKRKVARPQHCYS